MPKRIILIAVIFIMEITGMLSMARIAEAGEPWRNANYPYRREITIENDNMDETFSNFTVLIKFTDASPPALDKAKIADGRYTFYDSSGNELNFENESYSESGTYAAMETWVEIGTLNSDDNTGTDDSIWMYYGYDGGDQDDGSSAWDTDGNWAAVWHLKEDVVDEATVSDAHEDSTSNANYGDQYRNVEEASKISNGQSFDGNADYIQVDDHTSLDASAAITVSAWFKRNGADTDDWGAIVNKAGTSSTRAYLLQNAKGGSYQTTFGISKDGSNLILATDPTPVTNGVWYYYSGTWDGDTVTLYRNGSWVDDTASTAGSIFNSEYELYIGRARAGAAGTSYFHINGTIDEVRISTDDRSAAWIKFEHANMGGQADNELILGNEEINISGTVYTDEGSTNIGANKTVALSINGGTTPDTDLFTDETDSNGAYDITIPIANISAGDTIIAFIDGETGDRGCTVSVSDGALLSGFNIYEDHVIVRHDNSGNMTNTLMNTADNGDTDIDYSVTGGVLTVGDANDVELYIASGHTFKPGGNVNIGDSDTASDLEILGTWDADTHTTTLYGNWDISSGTFTYDTSTVTLSGTSQQILGSTTFYNLSKTVASADTLTFGDNTTQTIAGGFPGGGALTLQGANGAVLSLRTVSDNGTAKFSIHDDGTELVSYVNVKDGTATHGISATYSIDAGGNTNWTFSSNLVNSTADTLTAGTLRYAITNVSAGQSILFDTTVFPSGSPATITVTSTALPSITQGNITIDASANAGGVIIDGTGLGAGIDGLTLASTGNTIKGLKISTFPDDGIVISSGDNTIGGTSANEGNMIYSNGDDGISFEAASGTTTIVGNYIGTNSSYANLGNTDDGIYVNGQGTLTIGGTAAGSTNVIGFQDDTSDAGIYVNDGSPTIQGNYIGTNSADADLGNYYGIYLASGADAVSIGGTASGVSNTISMNDNDGINNVSTNTSIVIQGNYIGTDSGGSSLANGDDGIQTTAGTITIGNASEAVSNVIGPNTGYGINISNAAATVNFAGTVTINDDVNFAAGNVGLGTATLNVSGNWTNAATLTTGASTVTFNGSADQTITTGGDAFHNLQLNNAGETDSDDIVISGALDVNALLTITNGDLDVSTNDPAVNIGGGMMVGADGSIDLSAYSGTWTYDGTGALTDNRSTKGNLGTFTIDGSSAVLTLGSDIKATSISVAGDDTLNLGADSYTLELTGTGTPLSVSGTFNKGTGSTVNYTGVLITTNVATVAYNNLAFTPLITPATYNLTGNLTGSNAMSGNLTIGFGVTLDAVNGSNYGITLAGDWNNSGTFTARQGTVTFNGSADQAITTGGDAFYNLQLNNTGGTEDTDDLIISGALDVNGLLTITDGELDVSSNDPAVNIAGGMTVGADGSIDLSAYAGTWTFDGTGALTDNRSTKGNLGTFTIDGSSATLTLGSDIKATSISIAADDILNLGAGSYALELTGTGTPLTATGTFNKGTGSTVNYTGSGTATNVTTVAYNNLTFTPSSATTYNMTGSLTSSNAMSGNLTINTDATLDVRPASTDYDISCVNITVSGALDATSSSATITSSGNWNSASGDWTAGTSTVVLTESGSVAIKQTAQYANRFYILSCAAADKTTTASNTMYTEKLTVGSGTFTGGTFYVYGTGDAFTDGGATITFTNFNFQTAGGMNIVGRDYTGITYLYFNSTSGTTFELQGALVANNISIWGRNTDNLSTFNTNNYSITATGLAIGAASSTKAGLLNAGSSVIDINGDVTIYTPTGTPDNEINADTSTWTVSGDWTNGDTFTYDESTITLDGTTQTITGSNTFYNLSKTVSSADTLTFDNTATQTITNSLTLNGAAGQLLSLRSDSDGNQWSLTVEQAAAYDLAYLDVKDSDASGGQQLNADNSVNSGNNLNWVFDAENFFLVF